MKTCSNCGIEKPTTDFYAFARSKDGLQSYCRICNKMYHANYQRAHKERLNEISRKWNETHCEKVQESKRKWNEARKAERRERRERKRKEGQAA